MFRVNQATEVPLPPDSRINQATNMSRYYLQFKFFRLVSLFLLPRAFDLANFSLVWQFFSAALADLFGNFSQPHFVDVYTFLYFIFLLKLCMFSFSKMCLLH
jgi:hypothetical protein